MKRYALAISLFAAAACTATPAEPAISTAISELGNACTIQCRNGYLQCNSVCERFPRPNCEENCDARFLNCMRSCGCPFNEEFDRISFDHATATNTYLCVGASGQTGLTYRKYDTFNRVDHWQRTLQCDGTTTETLLSSTIEPGGACYSRLFPDQSCPRAVVSANQICVF